MCGDGALTMTCMSRSAAKRHRDGMARTASLRMPQNGCISKNGLRDLDDQEFKFYTGPARA
jgi:hypothetical protein